MISSVAGKKKKKKKNKKQNKQQQQQKNKTNKKKTTKNECTRVHNYKRVIALYYFIHCFFSGMRTAERMRASQNPYVHVRVIFNVDYTHKLDKYG